MRESDSDFGPALDLPPGIADREVGLVAVLKKLRYEISDAQSRLTAAQGQITEALRMAGEIPELDTAGERVRCPKCTTTFKGPRTLAEHDHQMHDGPEPEHWLAIEARSLEPQEEPA
jgi:hypothetical protein